MSAPDRRWSRCSPSSWTTIWATWRVITAAAITSPRRSNILGRAGQQALQRSAYADALSSLRAAIDLFQRLPNDPERSRRELLLQLSVGHALMAVKGLAVPEAERAFTRARELCERVGDPTEVFSALWGLWLMHLLRGELRTAYELAERLMPQAQSAHDPALLRYAHTALGDTTFFMGVLLPAREHLEMAISHYDPERHRPLGLRYSPVDDGVICLSYMAGTLWYLGYPDQSLKRLNEALTLARTLSHPFNLAWAEAVLGAVYQLRREARATQETAESAIALSDERGFPDLLARATI